MGSIETEDDSTKKVGFIVNPIAGMGGAVGLKGTDGKEILEKAIVLGAKPVAPKRAKTFLSELQPIKEHIQLIVGASWMGEKEASNQDFYYTVFGENKEVTNNVPESKRII